MGWSGMTPAVYATLSDWYIFDVLFARRTKKGRVVPEWRLELGEDEEEEASPRAWGKFKSAEELGVPDEAFRYGESHQQHNVPTSYVLCFWQVWAQRGLTPDETMEKWKEQMASMRMVYR